MRKNIALIFALLASGMYLFFNGQFLYFARAYWFFVITQTFLLCLLAFCIASIRINRIALNDWQRLAVLMLCVLHLAVFLQRVFLIKTFSTPVFIAFPLLLLALDAYLRGAKKWVYLSKKKGLIMIWVAVLYLCFFSILFLLIIHLLFSGIGDRFQNLTKAIKELSKKARLLIFQALAILSSYF